MDELELTQFIKTINSLSYKDKLKLFKSTFSTGYLYTKDLNDKLILISLLALTTKKLKEKDPSTTPLSILMKLTNQVEDNSGFYHLLQFLSILTEDFSTDVEKIDSCGFKTSQEIINKIKQLLSQWIPF